MIACFFWMRKRSDREPWANWRTNWTSSTCHASPSPGILSILDIRTLLVPSAGRHHGSHRRRRSRSPLPVGGRHGLGASANLAKGGLGGLEVGDGGVDGVPQEHEGGHGGVLAGDARRPAP